MAVNSIRVFKRMDAGEKTYKVKDNRVVFIVRSLNKTQVGQIVWLKNLNSVTFESTIQSYTIPALCEIIGFMNSLQVNNVDLIINEAGEVRL